MSIEAGDETLALPNLALYGGALQLAGLGDSALIVVSLDKIGELDVAVAIKTIEPIMRHLHHPRGKAAYSISWEIVSVRPAPARAFAEPGGASLAVSLLGENAPPS